jgi:hypothetical protein
LHVSNAVVVAATVFVYEFAVLVVAGKRHAVAWPYGRGPVKNELTKAQNRRAPKTD